MTSVSPVNNDNQGVMDHKIAMRISKSFSMILGSCLAVTLIALSVVLVILLQANVCDSHDCQNGNCKADKTSNRGYTCVCVTGYVGDKCEDHVCDSNNCQNGATCQADQSSEREYRCYCTTGYVGETCEVNVCANHECENGGICEVDLSKRRNYTCNCVNGYIGDLCKDHVCDSHICQNGATCQADESSEREYRCYCTTGYVGETCEVNVCANHECDNGGICEVDLSKRRNYTCNCVNGYIGDLCKVLPTDCKDLRDNGYNSSGVYGIYPFQNNFRPVRVYCDMETMDGGWTAIQKRVDGSLRFNGHWAKYKNGFGAPEKNIWIGNDVIHQLTKGLDSSLYISIALVNGKTLYELYDRFFVSNESNKYQLHLSGRATGTLGDAMLDTGTPTSDQSTMYFSTPDRDNDRLDFDNCAAIEDSGWWFNACYLAFLNGPWGRSTWVHPWHPTVESGRDVRRTSMMVKRT